MSIADEQAGSIRSMQTATLEDVGTVPSRCGGAAAAAAADYTRSTRIDASSKLGRRRRCRQNSAVENKLSLARWAWPASPSVRCAVGFSGVTIATRRTLDKYPKSSPPSPHPSLPLPIPSRSSQPYHSFSSLFSAISFPFPPSSAPYNSYRVWMGPSGYLPHGSKCWYPV